MGKEDEDWIKEVSRILGAEGLETRTRLSFYTILGIRREWEWHRDEADHVCLHNGILIWRRQQKKGTIDDFIAVLEENKSVEDFTNVLNRIKKYRDRKNSGINQNSDQPDSSGEIKQVATTTSMTLGVLPSVNTMAIPKGNPKGDLEGVTRLLGNNAEVNAIGEENLTPLHCAILHESPNGKEIVQRLCKYKANINARAENGLKPLHYAAIHGKLELFESLIDNGCDINMADDYGWTPLSLALLKGKRNIVEYLVNKEVDLSMRNGLSILDLASGSEMVNCITPLLNKIHPQQDKTQKQTPKKMALLINCLKGKQFFDLKSSESDLLELQTKLKDFNYECRKISVENGEDFIDKIKKWRNEIMTFPISSLFVGVICEGNENTFQFNEESGQTTNVHLVDINEKFLKEFNNEEIQNNKLNKLNFFVPKIFFLQTSFKSKSTRTNTKKVQVDSTSKTKKCVPTWSHMIIFKSMNNDYDKSNTEITTVKQLCNQLDEHYDLDVKELFRKLNLKLLENETNSFIEVINFPKHYLQANRTVTFSCQMERYITQNGLALIINNKHFVDNNLNRDGAETLTSTLKTCFESLGINCIDWMDQTTSEISDKIEDFKKKFIDGGYDFCFVFFSSHGAIIDNDDFILAKNDEKSADALLNIQNEIIRKFDNENFSGAKGKPKIFLFQACRNEFGKDKIDNKVHVDGYSELETKKWKNCKDMAIFRSTMYGYFSIRCTFVNCLVNKMEEHSTNDELLEIFKKVAENMYDIVERPTIDNIVYKNFMQMCPLTLVGFKQFYFPIQNTIMPSKVNKSFWSNP